MYLLDVYREYKTWKEVGKIAKEYKDQLLERGFRVDWIGRIYTVINLPEEVQTAAPQIQEGYVLMKLREFDKIFLDLGIASFVVPEMERIEEEGTAAFLLILSPDREYIKLWPFIKSLVRTAIILVILRIIYVVGSRNWEFISDVWEKMINFIL